MAKKKKVKKFQAGGDPRLTMASPYPPGPPVGIPRPPGPVGPGPAGGGSATGSVEAIMKSGAEARDFLGTAGQALGTPRTEGLFGGQGPIPQYGGYKKGGKTSSSKKKKSASGGKVRGAGMAKKGVRPVKMVTMKG